MPARRAFLSGALSGLDPRFARLPAERIALLKDVAQQWDQRLPKGSIPGLRAGDACAGHGICVSVCPTGALRRFEQPGVQGLEFEAAVCFACGACIVVCPEQALQLAPCVSTPDTPERIARYALRLCARCDDEFAVRGEEELCTACRKDVGLFTHGFPARSDGT